MNERRLRAAGWAATGALALAAAATALALYSRNTLSMHAGWGNVKMLQGYSTVGSFEATITRNLMQGNRLNLGVWHGHHEIAFQRPVSLGVLSWRFRAGLREHVDVSFGWTPHRRSVVRLSGPEGPGSAVILARGDGAFETIEPFPYEASGGWRRAQLRWTGAGGELSVDGRPVARLRQELFVEGLVAFSGMGAVDDVEIVDRSETVVARESFANRRQAWAVFAFMLAVSAAFCVLVRRVSAGPASARMMSAGAAAWGAAAAVTAVLTFDVWHWSGRYAYAPEQLPRHMPRSRAAIAVEKARLAAAGVLEPLNPTPPSSARALRSALGLEKRPRPDRRGVQIIVGRPGAMSLDLLSPGEGDAARYARSVKPRGPAVVVLGTSQAWGMGARRPTETLQWRLHEAIAGALGGPITTVNGSMWGEDWPRIFPRYQSFLSAFRPRLVIVILGHNGRAEKAFSDRLEELARFNQSRGTRTLFVIEPTVRDIRSKAALMRIVARRWGMPCFDLNAAMMQRLDTGFLYWDAVHLTSYGQLEAARLLAPEALRLLR